MSSPCKNQRKKQNQFSLCGCGGIGSLPVSAAGGRESEQSKGAAVEIFFGAQAGKISRTARVTRARLPANKN